MVVHVFNLDPGWNFPQLVIDQGLDLFPAASGVELVSFSASEDRGGGLASLFRSWPTIASGDHIIGPIDEFVAVVQSQNSGGANIGLLVCLGREALDRFRPEKPRVPVSPETTAVPTGDGPPQMLASRRASLPSEARLPDRPGPAAIVQGGKQATDPLTLLVKQLNRFRASSITQKTFTVTFFATAQGETDRVAAFEAGQGLLLQLDESIRWLSSVVICAENGTITPARSFAYLRTLIDMLQDRSARTDMASADLRGKLFVQTSAQHGGARGQALWLTNLEYGKTYSASLRSAIAGEIHAAARNLTLSETSTIAKVPLPAVQLDGLLKTLDANANNLSAKGPVTGSGEGGGPSPVQPVAFSTEPDVSGAVRLVRADVESSTGDALVEIQEGLDKARKDVAAVDDQIEAALIQVGGTEAWRDNAAGLNRRMQQAADKLAATARATRERAKFLTVRQGGDGNLLIELERLPQWKKTEADISQYYQLRSYGVTGRNAVVQLLFGIAVPVIVALGPYQSLLWGGGAPSSTAGQQAKPEMAFVIAFCIAFVLLSGFVAISASHFLHKRKMTLKRNDAEVGAGTLKADLVASAQAVEVARAAAIVSGHNRILARKVRDALGRSQAITSLADLVTSQPDRNLVDDAVSRAFIEQFTHAQAHSDGADRIRVAIVKSLALFRDAADVRTPGAGLSRLQINNKDENLDDYPVVANFSPGLVKVDVDKISVTGP